MMGHRTFSLRNEIAGRATFVAVLLALAGYLVGASYVGAEWQHGTMAALLLWEPRRVKVYTAKLFALLTGLLVVGVITYAVAFAAHWVVADLVGDPGGVGRGFQRSLGLAVARGLALSLAVAACGFAIAYAVRLSAAALGVAIAYIVGAEVGLRAFSQESQRWLLTENITAWLNRGTNIYLSNCDSQGTCTEKILHVSMWQGGAYVGGLALVLVVVAAIVFARRDVT
jgi:ABC-type transport system involved in multi-copper enzyme maturation permease subunit